MRRAFSFVAAAMLLAVLPLTFSGCWVACGCLETPDPNWTPLPVPADAAASAAAKLADVPAMTVTLTDGPNARRFYIATAPQTIALIDAVGGMVLEVVFEDRMPDDATESVTTADARTAAEAFMQKAGLAPDGLTESVSTIQAAGVAAYQVIWTDPSGVKSPEFEVSVNAATGSVFAFLDERMLLNITAPVIGSGRATQIAIAAFGATGAAAGSAELSIDFTGGSQASIWRIRLNASGGTAPDAEGSTPVVSVDAVTGNATVAIP
jgi:hypothetical protein